MKAVSIDAPGMTDAMKKQFLTGPANPKAEKHCVTEQDAKSADWMLGGEQNKSCQLNITMKDGKLSGSATCGEQSTKTPMTLAGTYGADAVSMDITATVPAPAALGLGGNLTTVMRVTGKRIGDSCTSKS